MGERFAALTWRGGAIGSTSRSERETAGSSPDPATKTDMTSVIRCRERWWRSEEKAAVLIEALRLPCRGFVLVCGAVYSVLCFE